MAAEPVPTPAQLRGRLPRWACQTSLFQPREPAFWLYVLVLVGTGLQVHVLRLPHNQGITAALNAGLDWIVTHTSAPYIARLDCRDLCDGERFGRVDARGTGADDRHHQGCAVR